MRRFVESLRWRHRTMEKFLAVMVVTAKDLDQADVTVTGGAGGGGVELNND